MFYTYILECDDRVLYAGFTNDLLRRYEQHVKGQVKSTKKYSKILLVAFEEWYTKKRALAREKELKSTYNKRKLVQSFQSKLIENQTALERVEELELKLDAQQNKINSLINDKAWILDSAYNKKVDDNREVLKELLVQLLASGDIDYIQNQRWLEKLEEHDVGMD